MRSFPWKSPEACPWRGCSPSPLRRKRGFRRWAEAALVPLAVLGGPCVWSTPHRPPQPRCLAQLRTHVLLQMKSCLRKQEICVNLRPFSSISVPPHLAFSNLHFQKKRYGEHGRHAICMYGVGMGSNYKVYPY